MRDRDLDTSFSVSAEYPLHIDIRESQPAWLCIAWEYAAPKRSVRFLDKNNILLEEVNTPFPFHNEVLSVPQNTQYIELQGLEDAVVSISDLYLYGEGALPEPWCYDWQPTPEKLDFLVVATHFDDDAIWLGAVMPLLGAEEGYTGVILYMTYQQRLRLNEALMGAWTMGERGYPLFSMLPDVYLENTFPLPSFHMTSCCNIWCAAIDSISRWWSLRRIWRESMAIGSINKRHDVPWMPFLLQRIQLMTGNPRRNMGYGRCRKHIRIFTLKIKFSWIPGAP